MSCHPAGQGCGSTPEPPSRFSIKILHKNPLKFHIFIPQIPNQNTFFCFFFVPWCLLESPGEGISFPSSPCSSFSLPFPHFFFHSADGKGQKAAGKKPRVWKTLLNFIPAASKHPQTPRRCPHSSVLAAPVHPPLSFHSHDIPNIPNLNIPIIPSLLTA